EAQGSYGIDGRHPGTVDPLSTLIPPPEILWCWSRCRLAPKEDILTQHSDELMSERPNGSYVANMEHEIDVHILQ
ncbi:hypothetical protein ALC56_03932, partial [Trachymyrmex septentrionalis]